LSEDTRLWKGTAIQ